MIEARAFLTSMTAALLAAACARNTGATEATSGATADVTTSSVSETSANIATSTTSSSTTTSSGTTPDTSTTGEDPSTGAPAMPCHLALDEASCEAGVDCVFIPGIEMRVRGGECLASDLGEVGFCYPMAGGGPDTPSFYYQIETGRVFAFLNSPAPPDGWVDCTCGPPSPDACLCWSDCSGETSSGG